MPRPTETALKGRARTLLEAMTERAHWIYAIPAEMDPAVRAVLGNEGFRLIEEEGPATRWEGGSDASIATLASAELEVVIVTASGGAAVEALGKVLDRTGFYAQSTLLGTALDVKSEEASKSLKTLAHMVVAWDEDWSDLFLLHLASPDAVVRHEAVLALTIAAMVARDAGPAVGLLEEAIKREKFPKLKETMTEAKNVVSGLTGGAITVSADGS